MKRAWAAALLAMAGCGRYADFTLPRLQSGNQRAGFVFEPRPEPVLARGAAGEWDAHDALNPSVVRSAGGLLNFYSGFDGRTWRTGLATSADEAGAWRIVSRLAIEQDVQVRAGAFAALARNPAAESARTNAAQWSPPSPDGRERSPEGADAGEEHE